MSGLSGNSSWLWSNFMRPRLRQGDKFPPPYPLNHFREEIVYSVGKALLAARIVRGLSDFSGQEWESAFARAIGASWIPSNLGLDDVQLQNCCWGAKTVKSNNPHQQASVRLISGRNSPAYSFGQSDVKRLPPSSLGKLVLDIWNERVGQVRARFQHVRTVVLLKGPDLRTASMFEFETIHYDPSMYLWEWNSNDNLVGRTKDNVLRFTWQPHGSQFTISEPLPEKRYCIAIREPQSVASLDPDEVLYRLGYNNDWIQIS